MFGRVNFLLHHELAARDLGRPESAAGAMLPDVWRMADRRARARGEGNTELETGAHPEPGLRAAAQGLAHHLRVDAWFHRAPVFVDGETAVRQVLRRASAPKIGLFAHVAWDLCLDGALLRRRGTPRVLAELRESVASLRPVLHHRLASAHTLLPDADRALFEARVDRILDAIVAGPWVAGYATGLGIAERLDGLRRRLGLPPMSAADRESIALGLESQVARADAALDEITQAARA
jgi:hypothetical protein